jgi:GntR family transcriptional regulator
VDFKDNLPIYIQIMNLIKGKMVSGQINGGDKLPSVRELSKELKVNPNTIQRTYQELEREELVFTQRGMGTFVTEDKEIVRNLKKGMATNIINNFIMEMKKLGFKSNEIIEIISEWIDKEEIK